MDSYTHLALRVTDLRAAEAYYCDLFDLTPAFREAEVDGTWRTLPADADWADADAAGVTLDLSYLTGGFELALERVESVTEAGRLSHVGLAADEAALDGLRVRLADADCEVRAASDTGLVFADRFGVTWEVSVGYAARSTGERTGRWLAV